VIVTDHSGRFVEGLRREDFRVYDNGIEQPLTGFAAVEEPAQVLFLIESGPAVLFLGKNHVRAADTLINNLSPNDRIAIASYSKDPELLLDFTPDKTMARLALQNLNFMAGFGQLKLSSSLASTIDWLAPFPGKKTVVVLSSGVDTSPPEKWQVIQQKLRTSDVRILAVSLAADFRKFPKWRNSRLRNVRTERSSSKALRRPTKRCTSCHRPAAGASISPEMRRNSIARTLKSRNSSATSTASRSARPQAMARFTRFKSK
jgi:VWFA-related protein